MSEAELESNSFEIDLNVNDTDTLPKLLIDWKNIQKIKKELLTNEEKIKNKVKVFLKERRWEKYLEPTTNMSITLSKGQTESFDKQKLKLLLTDAQYNDVRKITTYERLMILTSDDRERLKKFLKPKI